MKTSCLVVGGQIVALGCALLGCAARSSLHRNSQPASSGGSLEVTESIAHLRNSDIYWDGNLFGLYPTIKGAPAKRLVEIGPPARPALLIALRDPDKFATAHVVLTTISQ